MTPNHNLPNEPTEAPSSGSIFPDVLMRPLARFGVIAAFAAGGGTAVAIAAEANASGTIPEESMTIGTTPVSGSDTVTFDNYSSTSCYFDVVTTFDSSGASTGSYETTNITSGQQQSLSIPTSSEGNPANLDIYDCSETSGNPTYSTVFTFAEGYSFNPNPNPITTTTTTATTPPPPPTTSTANTPPPPPAETTTSTTPTASTIVNCVVPAVAAKRESLQRAEAQLKADKGCIPGKGVGSGYPKLTKAEKAHHERWSVAAFAVKSAVLIQAHIAGKFKKTGAYSVVPVGTTFPQGTAVDPYLKLGK